MEQKKGRLVVGNVCTITYINIVYCILILYVGIWKYRIEVMIRSIIYRSMYCNIHICSLYIIIIIIIM